MNRDVLINNKECKYPALLDMIDYLKPLHTDAECDLESLTYRLVSVLCFNNSN